MIVTATEFKTNFGKYLDMLTKEDIFITRNGKIIAKVINPQVSAVDSLRGMLKNVPSDIDLDSLREERLSKYEDHV
ncbi:MAG TPA: type II toxin-antitoxin system Phd/YefM family antitoxin [Candidatus Scatomonas pullistercoris]|uniref:Type II toxin-antitoxin system Phd/YefM family antitoxin n=1 Tax=Candidatus Scatomonas pullistercoris TaxID=2840920 RepID=A0A9D1P3G9_9FIRM|nr:type II toxin-antitoxin system Phd/YefM family antitoxin [Candidatus Scatomonas pullistercoris]